MCLHRTATITTTSTSYASTTTLYAVCASNNLADQYLVSSAWNSYTTVESSTGVLLTDTNTAYDCKYNVTSERPQTSHSANEHRSHLHILHISLQFHPTLLQRNEKHFAPRPFSDFTALGCVEAPQLPNVANIFLFLNAQSSDKCYFSTTGTCTSPSVQADNLFEAILGDQGVGPLTIGNLPCGEVTTAE